MESSASAGPARSVLMIFLDGVGLGEPDPAVNAFASARLPTLTSWLDGERPFEHTPPLHTPTASLVGLDAQLGVEGLPQSGTGQTSLLTGVNAPQLFGRHYGPWTPTALRPVVADESVLARAHGAGRSVAFANAYPEEVLEPIPGMGRRTPLHAAPPLAARGAGLLTRHTAALERGDAVASEIINDGWIQNLGRLSLPEITPESAGQNLAQIATAHDLTLFAHYTTDTVGHRRDLAGAIEALERVDTFLGGVYAHLPKGTLLLIVSDHGNLEDARVGHTRNPAIGLVVGPGHAAVARRLHSLTDVTPTILEYLGVLPNPGEGQRPDTPR